MKRSMKKVALGLLVGALSVASCMPAFAGTWQSDSNGWWYQKDDGTWYNNGWQWVDGNNDGVSECYYFTNIGYILTNTTTPDGYQVNADGAWIENNVVKTQDTASASEQTNTSQEVHTYTYKTDFIKQKYVNLLNNDEENMFRVMGERNEPSTLWGINSYLFFKDDVTLWCYAVNGKVVKIKDFGFTLLNLPPNTTFTIQQLDQYMGGGGYYNTNHDFVWKISDDYPIYAIAEKDIAGEKLDHMTVIYSENN